MFKCGIPEIVRFSDIEIPDRSVLRRFGNPADINEMGENIAGMYKDLCRKSIECMDAVGVYLFLKTDKNNSEIVTFEDTNFLIESRQVSRMLKDCGYIVLFVVSIGLKLEEDVNQLINRDRLTEAYIMDAIGSETADTAANKVHHELVKKIAEAEGYRVTPRFSPGYGDWDIKIQARMIDLCRGNSINVTVNEYSMMIPKKSVSGVFGLKKN